MTSGRISYIICLPIMVSDIHAVLMFWCTWIQLLKTSVCKPLHGIPSFLLGEYLAVELLSHR